MLSQTQTNPSIEILSNMVAMSEYEISYYFKHRNRNPTLRQELRSSIEECRFHRELLAESLSYSNPSLFDKLIQLIKSTYLRTLKA